MHFAIARAKKIVRYSVDFIIYIEVRLIEVPLYKELNYIVCIDFHRLIEAIDNNHLIIECVQVTTSNSQIQN